MSVFSQNKRNKWFTVIVIATILLIALFSNGKNSDTQNQPTEIANLKAQLDSLQKQLESEKQRSAESSSLSNTNEEEKPKEESPQNSNENKEQIFKIVNVVDGDTVKLEGGEVVRYIGIDSPETAHPSKPAQCFGKEAGEKNRELVEGKEVRLVKDVSETDKYGRLLRYVYVGDILVNDYLVRNGYAKASSYPPDVKYQDQSRQRVLKKPNLSWRQLRKQKLFRQIFLRPSQTRAWKQTNPTPATAKKPAANWAAPNPNTSLTLSAVMLEIGMAMGLRAMPIVSKCDLIYVRTSKIPYLD